MFKYFNYSLFPVLYLLQMGKTWKSGTLYITVSDGEALILGI